MSTTTGHALAMRVLQSNLYAKLDDLERAECDALLCPVTTTATQGDEIQKAIDSLSNMNRLKIKQCEICKDPVAWDHEPNPICNDCKDKAPTTAAQGVDNRELAENLLRSAINIAAEKSPKWYKNSDEKIAAILALKDQWDTEAAKIGREVLPPESPTPAKCGNKPGSMTGRCVSCYPIEAKPGARDTVEGLDMAPIEARWRAISPGPWEMDEWFSRNGLIEHPDGMAICVVSDRGGTMGRNGVFIANAPADMEALLKEIYRLRLFHPSNPRKEAGKP